ncbi:protein THEMIS2 [Genypterus blacodes]|uniref:protein THEMIS2 n=1 Tax=Genypterus blacodes TaxID=154954 RepID=UPI003F75FF6F
MAGTASVLPLQDYIASLDKICLPKVLQVCSGVYFQGSIYELSGCEVCFSNGDLIKVIDIELLSVSCEDISNNEKFELPIDHTGVFKLASDEMPYTSLEEMLSLRPVALNSCLPFIFTCHSKMTIDNFTLGADTVLTVLSVEQHEGEESQVRCHVQGQQGASAEVCIPLSSRGEFYECKSEESFSLQEIMTSPLLRSRRFHFDKRAMSERPLLLSPIYQVHAIMHLRKNVLKFPSSLEVEVVDVTELFKDLHFDIPLTLTEVLSQPDESFPTVAEVLEGPESRSLLKCNWLPELKIGQLLFLHGKGTSAMVLASSIKGRKAKQYFLISQEYNGRFRRRPREFNSVYELYVALMKSPGLRVSVTRNSEDEEEEGVPALSVGEQLEVLRCERVWLPCGASDGQNQSVEALICQPLQEPDEGDDDEEDEVKQEEQKEELALPLHMQCHFVEKLTESKKYRLRDLGKEFTWPQDVKVVARDAELESDPLVGLACLRLEGAMIEPTIKASLPNRPEHCFQIPVQRLSMSVCFTQDPLPWPSDQPPKFQVDTVTEVTEAFYYEFCKQGDSSESPPPRPPKRNMSSSSSSKKTSKKSTKKKSSKTDNAKHPPTPTRQICTPTKEFDSLTLCKKRPPAPLPPATLDASPPPIAPRKHEVERRSGIALPNTYVKAPESKKTVMLHDVSTDVDSDHDYETVDMPEMVRKVQENFLF